MEAALFGGGSPCCARAHLKPTTPARQPLATCRVYAGSWTRRRRRERQERQGAARSSPTISTGRASACARWTASLPVRSVCSTVASSCAPIVVHLQLHLNTYLDDIYVFMNVNAAPEALGLSTQHGRRRRSCDHLRRWTHASCAGWQWHTGKKQKRLEL